MDSETQDQFSCDSCRVGDNCIACLLQLAQPRHLLIKLNKHSLFMAVIYMFKESEESMAVGKGSSRSSAMPRSSEVSGLDPWFDLFLIPARVCVFTFQDVGYSPV